MSRLREIIVVEDRTAESRCDAGFLRVRRLRLRNEYVDGTSSDVYDCDVVSRLGADAVVAVLHEIDAERRVHVLLRSSVRAPVYLRRHKTFVHPDRRVYAGVIEAVAGLIEEQDGPEHEGLCRRAAIETKEEVGLDVPPTGFTVIGDETFASPGIGDEKLFFCAAAAELGQAAGGEGDGSVMEEGSELVTLELGEAIAACRRGEIPDMKTEVALLRLADHLGYLPQLGCFADALPDDLAHRHDRLGVASASEPRG